VSGSSPAPKSPPPKSPPLVRAGGGAVWRRTPGGVEVVLVHRPAYDDWALPKGKSEPDETDEQAALREVREETGLSCRLGIELPSTTYADAQGRPKVVHYWSMTVIPVTDGGPGPRLMPEPKARREIDEAYWAPMAEARGRLTYPRDVVVLDALADFLAADGSGTK
jgi:8-oxo-dGTP pyrophosphatase MutT (NUDIX family)